MPGKPRSLRRAAPFTLTRVRWSGCLPLNCLLAMSFRSMPTTLSWRIAQLLSKVTSSSRVPLASGGFRVSWVCVLYLSTNGMYGIRLVLVARARLVEDGEVCPCDWRDLYVGLGPWWWPSMAVGVSQ